MSKVIQMNNNGNENKINPNEKVDHADIMLCMIFNDMMMREKLEPIIEDLYSIYEFAASAHYEHQKLWESNSLSHRKVVCIKDSTLSSYLIHNPGKQTEPDEPPYKDLFAAINLLKMLANRNILIEYETINNNANTTTYEQN